MGDLLLVEIRVGTRSGDGSQVKGVRLLLREHTEWAASLRKR